LLTLFSHKTWHKGQKQECGGGQRCDNLGEKGVESEWEVGNREQEVGFPRWVKVGEIENKYATLHNILQSTNAQRNEVTKMG